MVRLRFVPQVCPLCGCGCGVLVGTDGGEIKLLEPWKRHPVNEGRQCVKLWELPEAVRKDRLERPVKMTESGEPREIPWNRALEEVTEVLSTHEPEEVYFVTSAKATNEDNYVAQKLARALGTNNVDHCARL